PAPASILGRARIGAPVGRRRVGHYPVDNTEPGALQAALHPDIVHLHRLELRPEPQWVHQPRRLAKRQIHLAGLVREPSHRARFAEGGAPRKPLEAALKNRGRLVEIAGRRMKIIDEAERPLPNPRAKPPEPGARLRTIGAL